MKGVRDDGGDSKNCEGLVRKHLNEANGRVRTSVEGNVPDDLAVRGPHDGCFEGVEGLFTKSCGHEMSKGGRMGRGAVRDRVKEGANGVSKCELLLDDVGRAFDKEGRRETVTRVCEKDGREAYEAHFLVENGCAEVAALFWSEILVKAGGTSRKMSSSALPWPRVEAVDEMQKRICLGGTKAKCGGGERRETGGD